MTVQTPQTAILPGFSDPVEQAQRVFRNVLDAMAHPGKVYTVGAAPKEVPAPLDPATAAVALALFDYETPVWLDAPSAASAATTDYLRFHCGCPIVTAPDEAAFAIVTDIHALPDLATFAQGTDERPELSTTVIIQVESLVVDHGPKLTGPGIEGIRRLALEEEPEDFWPRVAANNALFPRGLDFILTAGKTVAAIPRTTQIEE